MTVLSLSAGQQAQQADHPGAEAHSPLRGSFAALRQATRDQTAPAHDQRRKWLKSLLTAIDNAQAELIAAVSADFGWRPAQETRLAELHLVRSSIVHAISHLKRWMADERLLLPIQYLPARARVCRQPLGIVGIISPWNYPLQLSLLPLVYALAAGNRVLLKPSELTPATSDLLVTLVSKALPTDVAKVVTGDAELARIFSTLPFDHLFFTGSTQVGRQVAMAAAANLTPVTLELGGKSPAIVADDADVTQAATSLVASKFLNAGQTCVAPDYVLATPETAHRLAPALQQAIGKLYADAAHNPDYTSIISDRHLQRLEDLIDDARLSGAKIWQVEPDASIAAAYPRRLTPTIVTDVDDSMKLMQEEIFGPVLPIRTVPNLDQAIGHVVSHPRPLALYYYGKNVSPVRHILARCVVGGVTVNDALWHMTVDDLPFGGVGESGIGAYHGEAGFLTFTKRTPVFQQSSLSGTRFLRPPYGRVFETMMRLLRFLN